MKQYTPKQIKLITSHFENGQKFIQKADFKQAEICYKNILKISPDIDEANNALAYVYTISNQHQKAVTVLQGLLKANVKDANLHHNLANNLFALAQYQDAIVHYQITIQLNPQFIDSYIQCGMAYRKLSDYESAFRLFNQALKLDVRNAKNYHFIAIANLDIENYSLAIKNATLAVEFAPNNVEYHLSLANILKEAGNTYEADIQYHRTCSKFPDYLDAFMAYGKYLIECKYFYEAIECFEHAQKLAPDNDDIADSLGSCHLGIANTETAMAYFNSALKKNPQRLSSLIGIEQIYQDTGKLDQAIGICDQIIAVDTTHPAGYILKAKVRKSTADDGLSQSLTTLLSSQLNEDETIQVNFALGKVYDDQKQYPAAFKHYSDGNIIKKKQAQYNRTATEDHYSEIIDFFNADFFLEHQHLGQSNSLPIMIVGMPRSGTTLTEQIISSHPDVAGAGEVKFWSMTINSLPSILKTPLQYPKSVSMIQNEHASSIVNNYEATLRKIVGSKTVARHITDKMPHNFLCVGFSALLFPNIKIIHTQRDPIDTCLSIYFQNFNDHHPYAYDLSDLGHYYRQYERLMRHWQSVLPGRIMDIHYSDTVSDPEYWSRALISHIGLEWDDACLSPHKLERSVKTASHWQVRQPIYKTSVQRWKHYEPHLEPLISALQA